MSTLQGNSKLSLVVRPGAASSFAHSDGTSCEPCVAASATTTTTNVSDWLPRGQVMGRLELLQACWKACKATNHDEIEIQVNSTTTTTTARRGRRCHCKDCHALTSWAKLYLPRAFLRISSTDNENCVLISIEGQTVYAVEKCVCVIRGGQSQERQYLQTQKKEKDSNTSEYSVTLYAGDVLRLCSPKLKDPPLDICVVERELQSGESSEPHGEMNVESNAEDKNAPKGQSIASERDGIAHVCQTTTKLAQLDSGHSTMALTITLVDTSFPKLTTSQSSEATANKVLNCDEMFREETNKTMKDDAIPAVVKLQVSNPGGDPVFGSDAVRELMEHKNEMQHDADQIARKRASPIDQPMPPKDKDDHASGNNPIESVHCTDVKSSVDSGACAGNLVSYEVQTLPHERCKLQSPALVHERCKLQSPELVPKASHSMESAKFVIYLVPKGTDMTKTLLEGNATIEGLKTHLRKRGAVVLDNFDKNHPPWPTHFVVSDKLQNEQVLVHSLGFESVEDFAVFLSEHSICCVSRKWAQKGNKYHKPPLQEPTIMEQYLGIRPMNRKRQLAMERDERELSKRMKLDKNRLSTAAGDSKVGQYRNEQLSQLFHKLSKLHQECPLLETDDWRAYSFHLLSGRIKHLNFDVSSDPEVLKKLKAIKGFGNTSMQIIEEYIRNGSSSRVEEFQTNPKRVAMKRFMNIWGVGRVKASELVHSGYQNLEEVRHALDEGKVTLDRNQYIGLLCYDDILEDMTRQEVETISSIVSQAVHERFPSAEIQTMGSYRRGKEMCGDADILIVHNEYQGAVPPRALGRIVDDLRNRGHIAHHLTFISGMQPENFETLPAEVIPKLTNPRRYGRDRSKADKETKSSYMGVFNSPIHKGKKRRVDIKFYPYSKRVFASLYFTGNGHFNRSMRLWATRKFNFTLSDDGLFERDTYISIMNDPGEEREVFDRLGLEWKEPNERDCFDAVIGKNGGEPASSLKEMSQGELQSEESEHVWVH